MLRAMRMMAEKQAVMVITSLVWMRFPRMKKANKVTMNGLLWNITVKIETCRPCLRAWHMKMNVMLGMTRRTRYSETFLQPCTCTGFWKRLVPR